MKNYKNINDKKIIFYSIFIVLIILGRVIFLDADLPRKSWLLELFTIDEGFYTQSAFNLYNYGSFTHNVVPYITGDAGVANLFQTILTYISLLIFGNNYYGVRIPSVFISLITIWLFYLTLQNIKEDNSEFTNYSIFFMVLYFVTDFEYLSISRIYVTTVFRMFFIVLVLYLFSRFKNNSFNIKKISLLTSISLFSVFFVSIYNIFLYSATVFTIFILSVIQNWKTNKKQLIKDMIIMIMISTIIFILYLFYLKLIYNMTLFEYIKLLSQNEHAKHTIFNLLKNNPLNIFRIFINSLIFYFSTNIFRFNLGLLLLFLLLLPLFISINIKKINIFNIFILSFLFFLFLQTISESTFYHKRLTVLLPTILILVWNIIIKLNIKNIFPIKRYKKYIYIIYTVIVLLFILFINYIQNIKSKIFGGLNSELEHGYNGNLTIDFIILNIIILIIIFIYIILKLLNNKIDNKILLFLLLPPIFLSIKFTYLTPEFNTRNTMMDIANSVNNKITTGKFAFSYRFYNKSIPVLNFYLYKNRETIYSENLNKILSENKAKFIIQNAYEDYFHINITNNSQISLSLNKLYYSGNGLYITLLNVNLKKEDKNEN